MFILGAVCRNGVCCASLMRDSETANALHESECIDYRMDDGIGACYARTNLHRFIFMDIRIRCRCAADNRQHQAATERAI